mgnify:CR=1 FL=1
MSILELYNIKSLKASKNLKDSLSFLNENKLILSSFCSTTLLFIRDNSLTCVLGRYFLRKYSKVIFLFSLMNISSFNKWFKTSGSKSSMSAISLDSNTNWLFKLNFWKTKTEQLKNAINLAEKMTGKNLTLPTLQAILIIATGKSLKIRSTNLAVGIDIEIPADIEEEGTFLIKGDILLNVVNNIKK